MLGGARRLWRLGATALLVLAIGACGASEETVRVIAASSLTDAFTRVAVAFETATPGTRVELSFAGSATIREQVLGGVDVDVVAVAGRHPMDALRSTAAITEAATVFASNEITIGVPADNPGGVSQIDDLENADLFIGACAPGVPCGDLAAEAFRAAGVSPSLDTVEPNVRALLSKLASGELDAGLVYTTDVLASRGEVVGVLIPNAPRTEYLIAAATTTGRAFADFVLADAARAILNESGFETP